MPSPPDQDEESDLALLYTSGTMGKPKGVRLSDRAVVETAVRTGEALEVDPSDRVLVPVPLFTILRVQHRGGDGSGRRDVGAAGDVRAGRCGRAPAARSDHGDARRPHDVPADDADPGLRRPALSGVADGDRGRQSRAGRAGAPHPALVRRAGGVRPHRDGADGHHHALRRPGREAPHHRGAADHRSGDSRGGLRHRRVAWARGGRRDRRPRAERHAGICAHAGGDGPVVLPGRLFPHG